MAGPWSGAVLTGSRDFDELIHYTAPWVKPQRLWTAMLGYIRAAQRLSRTTWDLGSDECGDVRQILLRRLARSRRRLGFDTGGRSDVVVFDNGTLSRGGQLDQRIAGCKLDAVGESEPFIPSLTLTAEEKLKTETNRDRIPTSARPCHCGDCQPAMRPSSSLPMTEDPDERLVSSLLPISSSTRAEVSGCCVPHRSEARGVAGRPPRARGPWQKPQQAEYSPMDSGPAHISAALGHQHGRVREPSYPNTRPRGSNRIPMR